MIGAVQCMPSCGNAAGLLLHPKNRVRRTKVIGAVQCMPSCGDAAGLLLHPKNRVRRTKVIGAVQCMPSCGDAAGLLLYPQEPSPQDEGDWRQRGLIFLRTAKRHAGESQTFCYTGPAARDRHCSFLPGCRGAPRQVSTQKNEPPPIIFTPGTESAGRRRLERCSV